MKEIFQGPKQSRRTHWHLWLQFVPLHRHRHLAHPWSDHWLLELLLHDVEQVNFGQKLDCSFSSQRFNYRRGLISVRDVLTFTGSFEQLDLLEWYEESGVWRENFQNEVEDEGQRCNILEHFKANRFSISFHLQKLARGIYMPAGEEIVVATLNHDKLEWRLFLLHFQAWQKVHRACPVRFQLFVEVRAQVQRSIPQCSSVWNRMGTDFFACIRDGSMPSQNRCIQIAKLFFEKDDAFKYVKRHSMTINDSQERQDLCLVYIDDETLLTANQEDAKLLVMAADNQIKAFLILHACKCFSSTTSKIGCCTRAKTSLKALWVSRRPIMQMERHFSSMILSVSSSRSGQQEWARASKF